MEMSFKGLLFGFVLVSLFVTLLLLAVANISSPYNMDTSEVLSGSLNFTKFNDSITSFSESAEDMNERFSKQNIFVTLGDVVISGFFDIATSMIFMIKTPFTLISGIFVNVLGIPAFFVNVLLGLLIFSMIFAIWRLIKAGS